jgi:hypothetical protein
MVVSSHKHRDLFAGGVSRLGGLFLLVTTGRTIVTFGLSSKGSDERSGERGFEAGDGEDSLSPTDGGAESACEEAQGGEILLEFGDSDRQSLCSGVEGCKVFFNLGEPASELGNLGGEVRT